MGLYSVDMKEEEWVKIPIWDYRNLLQTEHKYNLLTSAVLNMTTHWEHEDTTYLRFPDIDKLLEVIEPELIKAIREKFMKGERDD